MRRTKDAVKSLGDRIGYGAMYQFAQVCWEEANKEMGLPVGSSFAYGPCLSFTVPCYCVDYRELGLDDRMTKDEYEVALKKLVEYYLINNHCDLCCGAGWLTKRVKQVAFDGYSKVV